MHCTIDNVGILYNDINVAYKYTKDLSRSIKSLMESHRHDNEERIIRLCSSYSDYMRRMSEVIAAKLTNNFNINDVPIDGLETTVLYAELDVSYTLQQPDIILLPVRLSYIYVCTLDAFT